MSRLSTMKLAVLLCLCRALLTRTRSVELDISPDGTTVPAPPLSLESLTTKSPTYLDIMEHQHIVVAGSAQQRRVNGPSLAYVTPWNRGGYSLSHTYREKLTYIAPVWLQLRKEGGGVVVTGQHDIDTEWIQRLRSECVHCPKVVPRVMWEVKGALSDDSIASAAVAIFDVVVKHRLDGIVLELGEVWFSGDDAFRKIVHKISHLLKGGDGKYSYSLIVVVPMFQMTRGAASSPPPFPYLKALLNLVDGVTLNTYDYTVNSGGTVGPNAPYYWHKSILKDLVSQCDSKSMIGKIMLGVPLYGRDNLEALLSVQVLDKIRDSKADIRWNLKSKEHYIRYKGAEGEDRTVHFPSLLFLKERIDLANRLGVGISLWEMGQGLDYFYNLM